MHVMKNGRWQLLLHGFSRQNNASITNRSTFWQWIERFNDITSLDTAICFVTKLLCTSDGYGVVILEGWWQQRMEYLSQNDDFQHEFHVFHLKSHAESFILCA